MSSLGGIYSTGTASVAANGTTVTGTGTLWTLVAQQGDWFFANGNIGIVNSVTDDTHIVLSLAWTGGTLTNAAYNLIQMSWSRYDPSLTQAKVRALLAALANMSIIYAVPTAGTPDPSIGDNGQYALDFVNGRWWQKSGGVWSSATLLNALYVNTLAYAGLGGL